jgi:plasmid stabilization system protein ParE
VSAYSVGFTATARRDLFAIAADIAEHAGRRTAGRWQAELQRRAMSLGDYPLRGAIDDDLGPNVRRLVVHPYLVIYEVRGDERIAILRIVHGARDLPTLFP